MTTPLIEYGFTLGDQIDFFFKFICGNHIILIWLLLDIGRSFRPIMVCKLYLLLNSAKCAHLHVGAASSSTVRLDSDYKDSSIIRVAKVKDFVVLVTYSFTPSAQC